MHAEDQAARPDRERCQRRARDDEHLHDRTPEHVDREDERQRDVEGGAIGRVSRWERRGAHGNKVERDRGPGPADQVLDDGHDDRRAGRAR